MLRKAEDRPVTVKDGMLGGVGKFKQYHIMTKDEMEPVGRALADSFLEVGGVVGGHTHHGDTEVCYFLSGKGRVTDDDTVVEVGAGDVNICYDGHFHKIENIGDEPLRYLVVITYTR